MRNVLSAMAKLSLVAVLLLPSLYSDAKQTPLSGAINISQFQLLDTDDTDDNGRPCPFYPLCSIGGW